MMMPDYMEALISQYGFVKILTDLHKVVFAVATETGDPKLWLLEQDLSLNIQELSLE
jgi:hypothetical protein